MTAYQQSEISSILLFLLGVILPLTSTSMIGPSSQRRAAAMYACLGIAIMIGMAMDGVNPFRWGIVTGMTLSTMKLAAGIRFL